MKTSGIADAIAVIRARILYQPQPFVCAAPHRIVVEMHPVRDDRSRRQCPQPEQSIERIAVAPSLRILDIGPIFGDVNVHRHRQRPTQLPRCSNRLVGHREGGMKSNQSQDRPPLVVLDEALTLRESGLTFRSAAIALGRSIGQKRSTAQLCTRIGQHVERPGNQARRLMMIDQSRRPREQCLGNVEPCRRPQRRRIKAAIKPPPDLL